MTEDHEFMTTEEVAAMLRTTPETVRYWRHVKRGPKSFKVGRRVLYAREDVVALTPRGKADDSVSVGSVEDFAAHMEAMSHTLAELIVKVDNLQARLCGS